jgi:hypothetical protein
MAIRQFEPNTNAVSIKKEKRYVYDFDRRLNFDADRGTAYMASQ